MSAESEARVAAVGTSEAHRVRTVTVDSRRLVRPGTAFFALRSGRTDGHRFVAEALEAGCVAAVVSIRCRAGCRTACPRS